MDSRLKQVELLLEQGKQFTFQNFSQQLDLECAGEDTPNRLAWKTRLSNLLPELLDANKTEIKLADHSNRFCKDAVNAAWQVEVNHYINDFGLFENVGTLNFIGDPQPVITIQNF